MLVDFSDSMMSVLNNIDGLRNRTHGETSGLETTQANLTKKSQKTNHTHTHTYIHTYTHTHIHTYTQFRIIKTND